MMELMRYSGHSKYTIRKKAYIAYFLTYKTKSFDINKNYYKYFENIPW